MCFPIWRGIQVASRRSPDGSFWTRWEQKDDVNHLTTIWMRPSLYDIERKTS